MQREIRKEISSRVLYFCEHRQQQKNEKKFNHVKLRVKLPSKVFLSQFLYNYFSLQMIALD
jgi:hypothetical protein